MDWPQIRAAHPHQWLVVEVMASRPEGGLLIPTRLEVVARCRDGRDAMSAYRQLDQTHPTRRYLFVHTDREQLAVEE